jgi:microcin C transport system substrate-binding protein
MIIYKNGNKILTKIIIKFLLILSLNFFCANILLAKNLSSSNNLVQSLFSSQFQHGISLFGDLKYDKNFTHLDYVNANAPKGGTLKYGVEGGFNSLNNFILKGLPAQGLSMIYDSLAESVDDEIGSRYGLVASGIKISPDRKKIDFQLRQTANFHDGKKITADDVVFTFNKLITDGHPSYKMSYRDVEKVEKINQYLVRFILKNNNNRNLPLLIASLPILPKHFYENHDFAKSSLDIPLGSGPYKIKEFVANRSITFERVENYWGKDLPINRGRYNFDKIIYDYYRDNNVLVEAFKAQKYDIRIENIARNWANSYNIEAIKNGEIIKAEIPHEMPSPTQAFIFNLRKPYFQNIALRMAITQVFDFEWLRERIFYGSYVRNQSYFTNSEYGITDFRLPKSKGDGFNRENIIIAQNVLAKAGYKIIDNKLIDPQNKLPLEIEFLIDQKAFEMVIAPFIKNLKKLGISAKMRFVDENQFQTRVNNFDYDIIVGVIPQSIVPGSELFATFHSSQKNIKGSANLLGLNDKYVDDLVEKMSKAKTKSELKILTKKLDSHLLNNYYTIPQWYNNKHRILYRNIFDFPQKSPKYSLAIDSWWYKNN